MLTRQQTAEKVKEENGKWLPQKNITFVLADPSNDEGGVIAHIDIYDEDSKIETIVFWCMSHMDEWTEAVLHSSSKVEAMGKAYKASRILMAFIRDEELAPIKEETIPQINKEVVPTVTPREMKLDGMVEAYEKIIVGRHFSVDA